MGESVDVVGSVAAAAADVSSVVVDEKLPKTKNVWMA